MFRPTGTAYLNAGGTLVNRAGDGRGRKFYDRTGDEMTLDEVERITI